MAAHPTNPPLIKRDNGSRPTMGETQVINGRLMCMYQGQWRPAVRQHTIRAQLIRETDALGSYRYGRKQEGTTDVTAYLHKDRNHGQAWPDRPQIVFDLYAPATPRNVKPTGVLMDEDQIMLDPYDHPIRDFPGELPVILSSKIDGLWVEYYLRQNAEIKAYDLMARMPLIKRKGGTLPVRTGTLTERATKFRHRTGAITWHEKDGSKGIRDYVLSLLPPGARDTRSLNGDLTRYQQAQLKAVNQGTKPERRHKSKRQAEASAEASIAQVVSGQSVVGGSSSLRPYIPSGGQGALEPDNSPVVSQFLEQARNASTSNSKLHTASDAALLRPNLSRKRTRESGSEDLSDAERDKPPVKRVRVDGRGSIVGETLRSTKLRPLKRSFDDIAPYESIPGSDPPVPPSKRSKHELKNPGFGDYDRLHGSSASQRTTRDAKRVHQTVPKRHTPKPVTSMPLLTGVDQEVEGDSSLGYLSAYLHDHNHGDQGFLPESSSAPHHSSITYQQAHASMQPTSGGAYCGPSFAGLNDDTQKLDRSTALHTASLIQDDRYTAPEHLDHNDIPYSTAMIDTPSERSECSLPRSDLEPLPYAFQIEEHQALERGDHRYLNPSSTAEAALISEAIQLTRYDMILQLGEHLPQSLGNEDHHNESYMAQWHRLQQECVRCWKGPGSAPTLYGCAEIWTEFGSWLITDEKGLQLREWSAIASAL